MKFEVKDFNLEHIFDCGQCFRWEKQVDGSYLGIVDEKLALLKYNDKLEELTVEIIAKCGKDLENGAYDREFWENYLDLKRDYAGIKKELASNDEKIGEAINYGYGIRILKQDLFETVISFIISQNSNIPRIKKCINAISEKYGKFLCEYNGEKYYSFPTAWELSLAGIDELTRLKLGYRAEYIVKTVKQIHSDMKSFEDVVNMDYSQARQYLLGLTGIGPKVADCILLFGLGRVEAFPVDVWVKRVMNRVYGFDEKDLKGMQAFAANRFGDFGGIAQQYLFYYIRENS